MDLIDIKETGRSVYRKKNFRTRKDNDDFYIIWCAGSEKWYCASSTFYEIVSLCDGKNSVEDIYQAFMSKYTGISKGILLSDIKKSVERAIELNIITEGEK